MTNKVTFDSTACPDGAVINLACGYVSLNEIVFTHQNICVNIEAKTGEIEFCDLKSNKLLSQKVQTPISGDEKFSEVKCIVEGEQIKLGFPQYTYKDNYPNCDGESDRWTKTISGFEFLCYDFKNNCIIK